MKCTILDEDLHHLIKLLAVTKKRCLRSLVNEALIDVLKKYNIEIPRNLKLYENKNSI